MPPRSSSRQPLHTDQGLQAVLAAIGLVDNKLDTVQSSVARLQVEQSQQTSTLNVVDNRVRQLENEKINEARVSTIEGQARKTEDRLDKLERDTTQKTSEQQQMAKDVAELKDDMKPVKQFVDRGKFMFPLITGIGGIAGAVIAALLLKLFHL